MVPLFEIPVSVAGLLLAAASVVAGAPWFADGLRSLRARRALAAVRPESIAGAASGLCELGGRVELESPLFSPLSARPCAGYLLEVRGVGTRIGGSVSEVRPFRLIDGADRVHVDAESVLWRLAVTAEREVPAGAPIPERIRTLMDRNGELRWLRAQGSTLLLTERALCAGSECHVLGELRQERVVTYSETAWVAATGTDGEVVNAASIPVSDETLDRRMGPSDLLERIVIADGALAASQLAPPAWRVSGAVLGPALALAGLLYLAHAADRVFAGRLV